MARDVADAPGAGEGAQVRVRVDVTQLVGGRAVEARHIRKLCGVWVGAVVCAQGDVSGGTAEVGRNNETFTGWPDVSISLTSLVVGGVELAHNLNGGRVAREQPRQLVRPAACLASAHGRVAHADKSVKSFVVPVPPSTTWARLHHSAAALARYRKRR